MIGKLILLLLAYVIAAAASESVSIDLSQTDWHSLWTYIAWALSYVGLCISIFVLGLLGFAGLAVLSD